MTESSLDIINQTTRPRRRRGAKAKAKLTGKEKTFRDQNDNVSVEKARNDVTEKEPSCDDDLKKADNGTESKSLKKENGEKKKSKKRKAGKAPQPGEEGYLTPTQLRNARKRRATKRKKQKIKNSSHVDSNKEGGDTKSENSSSKSHGEDPSTKYLSNPVACPIIQRARKYFADLNLSFNTIVGKSKGWRTVSKLPVRMNSENILTIGLFKPKSHEVISVPNCTAHHSSINKTIKSMQILCKLLNIAAYQEEDGSGYLRYLCVNVSRSTKQVQLTLVWNSSPFILERGNNFMKDAELSKNPTKSEDNGKEQLSLLIKALEDQKDKLNIHSLWVHFNAQWKHADNIFDFGKPTTCHSLWKHIFGPKEMIETLHIKDLSQKHEVQLHFTPNVFRQANLDAFTNIIVAIRDYISKYNNERLSSSPLPSCLELYGGVGTIGLHLHDLFSALLSSDENPFNIECFTKSANLISKNKDKITYLSKDATSVLKDDSLRKSKYKSCEILIVDPPRKGLDDFVLESLTQSIDNDEPCILDNTRVLVYVSCGFDAFQSDCSALLSSKRWTLDHVQGHVLFPGSDAVETLAFFKSTLSN